MHTYPPPVDELKQWLRDHPSTNGNYGHLLLEQQSECTSTLLDELRKYFESAHFDARKYFHEVIGMDLHPDAEDQGSHACYPNCLPSKARRGLFGEVMAGLITESYPFVGNYKWVIPIFLFRNHSDAEAYIFNLARNKEEKREVLGRPGEDFIAISLGQDGEVTRFIAGEAKWRKRLTASVIDDLLLGEWKKEGDNRFRSGGIWYKLNSDTPNPRGLRQLQRLLQEYDPAGYSAAIDSLHKALLLNDPEPIPRTDLVLIVGNVSRSKEKGLPFISSESIPQEYTAGNDLQIVEVFLQNGEKLIDAIYDSLWMEGNNYDPE